MMTVITKIPTFRELRLEAPHEIKRLLVKCMETPQSPKWHPEGDVFEHTGIVYHRARKTGDINLAIAALFHDLGKVEATRPSRNTKGSWSAYGHEFISARLVDKHKNWIELEGGDYEKIREIVKLHMKIKLIDEMRPHKRRALQENPIYPELCQFTDCDNMKTLTKEELELDL